MFDSHISGEVPEHRDFIYGTAIPALERMGVKIRVLRGPQTYVGLFTGRITRGPVSYTHLLNASAGKVRSRIAVLDRLIARLRKAA